MPLIIWDLSMGRFFLKSSLSKYNPSVNIKSESYFSLCDTVCAHRLVAMTMESINVMVSFISFTNFTQR